MSRRRVVITGLGPITCIGKGVDGFWKGILGEKTGISPITGFDVSGFGVRVAGLGDDLEAGESFPPPSFYRKRKRRHSRHPSISYSRFLFSKKKKKTSRSYFIRTLS